MSYEIRTIDQIDNNNIKIGKSFKYYLNDKYYLTNIYYMNNTNSNITNNISVENDIKKQDIIDDKTKLIIQTPLLYIPNNIIHFNEKPFLELSFNNEDNDKDVSKFKIWISNLEDHIYKLIKRRTTLEIKKENMVSILKQKSHNYYNKYKKTYVNSTSTNLLIPVNISVSKCILTDDGKKNKILFNWEISVPTYAISIIWIKNIWVKNDKWGINLFMYASRVMNSHILDPIDFLDVEKTNKSIKTFDVIKQFKDDKNLSMKIGEVPEYIMFFKMMKMGIPKEAIKQKISLLSLDVRIIDYPEDTPYITVMHYISNPQLGSYIKPKSNQDSNGNSNSNESSIANSSNQSNQNSLGSILGKGALSNILGGIGGIKLKKVDPILITKDKILDKMMNNTNKLKVPSLNDIQGALSKLKKIKIDDDNINDDIIV